MIVIQEVLLAAVHEQSAGAVTDTLPVPAAGPTDALLGEIEQLQVPKTKSTVVV